MNGLSMGAYGPYVWSAVGLTVLVLAANAWGAWSVLNAARRAARRAHGIER